MTTSKKFKFVYEEVNEGRSGLYAHGDTLKEGRADYLEVCLKHGADPDSHILIEIHRVENGECVWHAWSGRPISLD